MYVPEGVFPAMPTPFTREGKIDEESFRELIGYYEDAGVDGVLVAGSVGEFIMMTDDMRMQMIEIAADACRKIKSVVNVSHASTEGAVLFAEHAREAGADAVIVVTPYYLNYEANDLVDHFKNVARESRMPTVVYNIPMCTNPIDADILAAAAEEKYVVATKDSSGDSVTMSEMIRKTPSDLSYLVGWDLLISHSLAIGGTGMMCGTAVFAPELCVNMYKAAQEGAWEDVFDMQKHINILSQAYFVGPLVAGVKACLNLLGLPGGHVRPPLRDLNSEEINKVEAILKEGGISVP